MNFKDHEPLSPVKLTLQQYKKFIQVIREQLERKSPINNTKNRSFIKYRTVKELRNDTKL